MTRIRIASCMLALLISANSIGVSFAQDPEATPEAETPTVDVANRRANRGDRLEIVLETISTATGLERAEITRLLREEDMTLAEIITANGGDVTAVQADLIAQLTDEFTSNIDQNVDDILNNPLPQRGDRDGRGPGGRNGNGEGRRGGGREGRGIFGDRLDNPMVRELIHATGIDPELLRDSIQADQSLSDAITANGGDPAEVIATAKADIEAHIAQEVEDGILTQEEADARLARLDDLLDTAMNSTPSELRQQAVFMAGVHRAVFQSAADALGVEVGELHRDLDGDSLSEYLTAQDADVESISAAATTLAEERIAEIVTEGDLTQEQADVLLADLDQAIADVLARVGKGGPR